MTAGAAAATAPLEQLISRVSGASVSRTWSLEQETNTAALCQREADKGVQPLGGRTFRENPTYNREKRCNPPLLENWQLGRTYAGRAGPEFNSGGAPAHAAPG